MCRAGLANGYPWITSLIAFIHVWGCLTALGYENLAHREISGGAASAAIVDSVLKNDIGFPKGLDEIVGIQSLYEWLRMGSEREDAALRFLYHFHDPLAEWEYAGLGHMAYPYSSIVWGLKNGQDWSWRKAREYFHLALTSPGKTEREVNLAKTFKALGHVVHLIQDAGSPAHARNDPHPFNVTYEKIIAQIQASQDPAEAAFFQSLLSNPWRPDSGWQSMAQDAGVPLPLARLFDTDSYGGTNPEVTTAVLMGLAEYTNANFFSEDRTFPEDTLWLYRYPYPARSSAVERPYIIQLKHGGWVTRRYFTKERDGDTGYRLATVGYLEDYLQRYNLNSNRFEHRRALDESVYRDYAAKLLPRAIGYSAALLDYFFRGKLDVRPAIDPMTQARALRIVNRSPDALGAGGKLALYREDPNGLRIPIPGSEVLLSEAVPKDNDTTPLYLPMLENVLPEALTVVYRGPLGLEAEAVIGKRLQPVFIEQVYRDIQLNTWVLRTSKGIHLLPLETVAGLSGPFERVEWGSRDNQLVGVTAPVRAPAGGPGGQPPTGPTEAHQAVLFEIDRPAGSSEIPLVPGTLALEYPSVSVRVLSRVPIAEALEALDLSTLVKVDADVEFRYRLPTYQMHLACVYVVSGPDESEGGYECTYAVGGDSPGIERTWTRTVSAEFPVRLDADHLGDPQGGEIPAHYQWALSSVQAGETGELFGLVTIEITHLPWNEGFTVFPELTIEATGATVEIPAAHWVPVNIANPPARIVALINLSARRLVAKTSEDVIHIQRQQWASVPTAAWPSCPVCVFARADYTGGPLESRSGWTCESAGPDAFDMQAGVQEMMTYTILEGVKPTAAEGLFRANLASLGLAAVEDRGVREFPGGPWGTLYPYRTNCSSGGVCAIKLKQSIPVTLGPAGRLAYLRLGPGTPGPLHLQLNAQEFQDTYYATITPGGGLDPVGTGAGGLFRSWFVRWNPVTGDTSAALVDTAAKALHSLMGNSSGVLARREEGGGLLWVSWGGGPPISLLESDVPGVQDLIALEPDYFFNRQAGTFHSLEVGLPITGKPKSLVPAPLAPASGYHVIGR
jgi:hypothetical protein